MKKIYFTIIICLLIFKANGQDCISVHNKIYHLNYKAEIPFSAGMFGLNVYGFYLLSEKPTLDIIQINALDMNDVWAFDRHVFSQSHSAPSYVYTISDIGLWTSYVLPALLLARIGNACPSPIPFVMHRN